VRDMKKLLFLTMMVLVMVASAFGAGTVTLLRPAENGTVTGQYYLNASQANHCAGTTVDTLCNISYYAKSASTANSTNVLLGSLNSYNSSVGNMSVRFNSATLEDGATYIFNVTLKNASSTISDTSTGVVVDNTVPVAPSSISPADKTIYRTNSYTISATVTGSRTTGCTIVFTSNNPEGSASQAMTHTANTCTYSGTATNAGTYDFYITASDGTQGTSSAVQQFEIQTSAGGGGGGGLNTNSYYGDEDQPDYQPNQLNYGETEQVQEQEQARLGEQVSQQAKSGQVRGRSLGEALQGIINWFRNMFRFGQQG